jgi:hypothetical protein
MKNSNFAVQPGASTQSGKNLVQVWQDAVSRMISLQSSLVRQWTTGIVSTEANRPEKGS